MNIDKLTKKYQRMLESRINYFLNNKTRIYNPLRYILKAGGKRIRPIITLLAAEAVGGSAKKAIDYAVGIEFLHTFTLIHDDIMDNSETRRGLLTIHKKWDRNTAILAGDFLAGLAYKVVVNSNNENLTEILKSFTNAYLVVCEGQHEDLELDGHCIDKIHDYLKMIEKKTAVLISTAAEIGAISGGGTKWQVNLLKEFGLYLGLAFQIKDDLLDVVGNVKTMGKPLYQDIIERKKTYLLLYANMKSNPQQRKILSKIWLKRKLSNQTIEKIRNIYIKSGALEEAERAIKKYSLLAKEKLDLLPDSITKEYLKALVDKIIYRNN